MSFFFFPHLCLYCERRLSRERLLCEVCAPFFELIEPKTRCRQCFVETAKGKVCSGCIKEKKWKIKQASALSKTLPVLTFLEKSLRNPHLLKTACSLSVLQLFRLQWPPFDFVTTFSTPLWKKLTEGPSQDKILAKSLSKAHASPYISFQRCDKKIKGKNVGIICLKKEEGSEKHLETLLQERPKSIYIFSLCE